MDAKSGAKAGTLIIGKKNCDLPLYEGTTGPDVIDISKLYDEAGVFTYDPGYTSTARTPR
jgi:citrate synthase